ncbi:glycosyltransferase [Azospirillum sp. TSO22-1]|uniref:glycosyltransferase family 2 protein n=1 Tax=Azospirillum sp. TSO22-1 TaxID=716789 RepID=UPI000D606257|nr:glycosyltransferase [Azospirillum sp. TSO22-1]PWC53955.1 cellulose synthase [Azospirillum sp. TSO22-1]
MRKRAIAVLILVILGNVGAWALWNRPVAERSWGGAINGVSYTPFHDPNKSPTRGDRGNADDIDKDMATLEGSVKGVRTYSTTDGSEQVAPVARKYGLPVTAGAWIAGKPEIDEPEINGLIKLARENNNVRRVLVGNEAILRTDISVPQAIELVKRVKKKVAVPVSIAEPWHVWLQHPELAEAVDFLAIHLLPYWEGVPIDDAVNYAMFRYNELKTKYPNKHILISEIGWPADGPWRRGAEASQVNQAKFIRTFLNVAAQNRLDYFIMEAFDQPWKREIEGTAGTSWGLWDAWRAPKFPMAGEVLEVKNWPYMCATSIAVSFLPLVFFLGRRRDLKVGGLLFYGALIQAVGSVLVFTVTAASAAGLATTTEIAWGFLIFCQLVLLCVMLIDGLELTEVVWQESFRRKFQPCSAAPLPTAPKVSIHVPCYNEPPHMVIETLDALARLDYPNFEVLLLDNNTKDPEVWKPVEQYCRQLGPRFRFFHLDNWPGFKAGALNFGLTVTAEDAQHIAVIDSDYQVHPDWLKATIPHFDRPEVGFVQSPQDYREWDEDLFQRMINWEYAGFFHIGMIQRNERNAIIQHGTMTIIRKTALEETGRWGEWCITEDADLGLRLFEHGYEAVYMPESFGKGLVPDSFSAYKTQRFRWAYGAVQILKHHWRELAPRGKRLNGGQKYHFITGWLPWFADAAHMIFGIAGIIWSLGLLLFPKYFEFPPNAFMIPTLSVFAFKVAASLWLYEARVKCGFWDKVGAAVAGMALTHTVGRAMWLGMFTSGRPFVRTPKCEDKPALMAVFLMAQEEIALLVALWGAALAIVLVFGHENRDAFMWSGLLVVQSLPYLAALITSLINVFREFHFGHRRPQPVPVEAAH